MFYCINFDFLVLKNDWKHSNTRIAYTINTCNHICVHVDIHNIIIVFLLLVVLSYSTVVVIFASPINIRIEIFYVGLHDVIAVIYIVWLMEGQVQRTLWHVLTSIYLSTSGTQDYQKQQTQTGMASLRKHDIHWLQYEVPRGSESSTQRNECEHRCRRKG